MASIAFRTLALCAALSVSGILLPILQAGAWALMLRDRIGTDREGSLLALVGEIVSGEKPCPRCHFTQEASLRASGPEDGDSLAPESRELRLVIAEGAPLNVPLPAPNQRRYHDEATSRFAAWEPSPTSPPPKRPC